MHARGSFEGLVEALSGFLSRADSMEFYLS